MKGRSTGIALAVAWAGIACVGCSRQPASENATAARLDSTAPKPGTDSTSRASVELRGTDWRLVALGDKPVTVADTTRAPNIILQRDSKQMAGSGGCNRIFGVYELNGEAVRFSGAGSTRMACKDGMETEAAFLSSLLRVARWKITGEQLELSDSAGVVLARFQARK